MLPSEENSVQKIFEDFKNDPGRRLTLSEFTEITAYLNRAGADGFEILNNFFKTQAPVVELSKSLQVLSIAKGYTTCVVDLSEKDLAMLKAFEDDDKIVPACLLYAFCAGINFAVEQEIR